MSTPFLGMIATYGFNFAPRGWAMCNGQILPIAQNTALFSLLGTTYGGNGQTTFALPDLRGRFGLGQGEGPGLTARARGERAGTESVALSESELPTHTHTPSAATNASSSSPSGTAYAPGGAYGPPNAVTMDPAVVDPVGGSQPH